MENESMIVDYGTKGKDLYNFIIEHMTYKEVMVLLNMLMYHTELNKYDMTMKEVKVND